MPVGRHDRDEYLRLDLGECEAPASTQVVEALRTIAPADLSRYPDSGPLVRSLAAAHGLSPDQVRVTAGTDEAIRWTFNAFVEEGARVVIPRPSFGALLAAAQAGGAFVERVDYEDDLSFPVEAFGAVLARIPPRLAVIPNPNAPTGSAPELSTIRQLAAASPPTLFLVDEVYVAYHGSSLLDGDEELPPNVLVMRSFSKEHGLAGLRIGYMVGHPEVIAAIDVVRPSYTVSLPSLRAAAVALTETQPMQARVARSRALMRQLVSKLALRGVQAQASRANFVLVLLTAPIQPWAAAFAAHRILVGTRGHVGPMAPWIRVTVNSEEEIERFLETLDLVLAQGISGAKQVRGVEGDWDELGSEGMA